MSGTGEDEIQEGLGLFAAALDAGAASGSHIGIVEFASTASRPLSNTWYAPTDATLTGYISGFSSESNSDIYWTNWEAAMAEANAFVDNVSGEQGD